MAYGVRLLVSGDYACFTRPEMKVERVSYDVMTPSAARGILEAIHWKPAIRWIVEAIHVLKPIRFQSIRRNEVGHKASVGAIRKAMKSATSKSLALVVEDERQQRAATVLVDVVLCDRSAVRADGQSGVLTTMKASTSTSSIAAPAEVSVSISPASARANSPPAFA